MHIGWIALVALALTGSHQAEADVLIEQLVTCHSIADRACLVAAARLSLLKDEALPPIAKRFYDFPREAQLLALSVIDGVDSARATELLVEVAKDKRPDPAVRALALDDLGARHYPKLVALLTSATTDPAPIVRVAAARGLANHMTTRDQKVLATLLKVARDPEASVRIEALFGLGFSGQPEAGKALMGALSDDVPDVRRAGAEGLGMVTHRPAVPRLVALLDDSDKLLVHAVGRALKFQTGQDFGDNATRWHSWLDEQK